MQDPAQEKFADGWWNRAAVTLACRERFFDEERIAVRAFEHRLHQPRVGFGLHDARDLRGDVIRQAR